MFFLKIISHVAAFCCVLCVCDSTTADVCFYLTNLFHPSRCMFFVLTLIASSGWVEIGQIWKPKKILVEVLVGGSLRFGSSLRLERVGNVFVFRRFVTREGR
jgi:hypothetical protein